MRKLTYSAAIVAASMFASSVQAAPFLVITGPSGNFGDDSVTCSGGTGPCSFSRTFSFSTPTGFNLASLNISSIATNNPLTNIDFTSVTFNGVNFNTLSTGTQEFRNLFSQALFAVGSNTLVVSGTTGGAASFTGNISFANNAAVPELATWAMMTLGFGAMGFAMRRKKIATRIRFA